MDGILGKYNENSLSSRADERRKIFEERANRTIVSEDHLPTGTDDDKNVVLERERERERER